jgi:hypothetical protein
MSVSGSTSLTAQSSPSFQTLYIASVGVIVTQYTCYARVSEKATENLIYGRSLPCTCFFALVKRDAVDWSIHDTLAQLSYKTSSKP